MKNTCASLLLQACESMIYIRDRLGHSSIKVTVDIYGHLVPGGNKEAVDRLDYNKTVTIRNQYNNKGLAIYPQVHIFINGSS